LESFELSQRRCIGAKQRREPSAALPLCMRVVAASKPDVLVTLLAIERASDYDLIVSPVVYDRLVRLQAPSHGHVECVSRVFLHGSRPEPRATGVTRLGPDGIFLYFDLALSSHCGFFRASVFLERSLMEHSETRVLERRCAGCPLCTGGPPVDSCLSALFHACTHIKKVCSSPLCTSDVQYSQEFCTPGHHVRNLKCCTSKSWLLFLISPTSCSFHHSTHQGPWLRVKS